MTIAGISALAANCLSHALQPVTQRTLEFIRYMHTPVAKWSGSLHGHEWSYIDGRPVSAAELFANLAKRNGTFDNQWLLSKLPVPGLDQSLNLFLESLEPILSKEEYQKTKEAAKVFREGRGASLHVQLLGLSYITTNWIKEMWLKCAYLMSRKPLILSSSWYGADSLRDYRKLYSPNNIQYERAARLVHLGLRRHLEIESNTYPPIILRGMMPICMDPYRYLFGTTRIPKEGMDELQTTKSNHIIVLANGHIYKVEVIEKGLLLCESSLRQQFAWILNDAKTRGQGEGISLLTGDERDRWAQNREKLIVENSKQLEAEYLREMKTIYRKMVEKTSKYNELRTKLKYRFPAKGKLAERRYLPLRAEPLSDFEGETDISRQLSSVRQLVEVQYKPFIKEDKELEMELQQRRQKKVRLRLVQ